MPSSWKTRKLESVCEPRPDPSDRRGGTPCRPSEALADTRRERLTSMENGKQSERGVLWIDAVGGYLLCLGDSTVVGQSIPGNAVDLPILGDLSRRHATIRRYPEGYTLEPHARCSVNRRLCMGATELHDGDEILLGEHVRLQFRLPHPLSTTARLDIRSAHRLQTSVDGILLFGNSCLMGPDSRTHVRCRQWQDSIMLTRGPAGGFRYRTGHRVEIDGQLAPAAGTIGWNQRLAGNEFALTIERQ